MAGTGLPATLDWSDKMKIVMNKQEMDGCIDYTQTVKVMTQNFKNIFKEKAEWVVDVAIQMIQETYPNGADYLQTFECHDDGIVTKFWLIVDKRLLMEKIC